MLPDFLVIGAQRSGTTWLFRALQDHPRLWLPPEKEIHYFSMPSRLPFLSYICSPRRATRRWMRSKAHRVFGAGTPRAWALRYMMAPHSDRWYASLFTPGPHQLAGEITPAYARQNDAVVRRIHALLPHVKLIYLMRHPIERMWSQAGMRMRRLGIDLANMSDTDLIALLSQPGWLANSRYAANLARWRRHYSAEQIFIGYFEQIRRQPAQLLASICCFLDIPPLQLNAENPNPGRNPSIPPAVARFLAETLAEDTERLHAQLDTPYTAHWVADLHMQRTMTPQNAHND